MVKTYGLTHIALSVRDPQRSLAFYQAVLGAVCVWRSDDFVQAQTPGSRDVLVFERVPRTAGKRGGVAHFGFRLTKPSDISAALQAVRDAGGKVTDHGEFVPGAISLRARSGRVRVRDLVRNSDCRRSSGAKAETGEDG